jgi:hypothetical protein
VEISGSKIDDTPVSPERLDHIPNGPRLRSQVAALQVRIVMLNGYTALGIPITLAVG